MAKRRRNLLTGKTVTVSYARNGLAFEIANVPAADGALVGRALLDAVRGLVQAGYDELVVDGGALHHDPVATPEEPDDEEFVLPVVAHQKPVARRRVGFA